MHIDLQYLDENRRYLSDGQAEWVDRFLLFREENEGRDFTRKQENTIQ